MNAEERTALRALRNAATEGEWQVGGTAHGDHFVWSEVRGYLRGVGSPPDHMFATGHGEQAEADNRLIVAAVNNLLPLLDALDEAERRGVEAIRAEAAAVRDLERQLGEAKRQRNALTLQLAGARGALNDYRDGYVGSDLAAGTLAGLDALRRPVAVPAGDTPDGAR